MKRDYVVLFISINKKIMLKRKMENKSLLYKKKSQNQNHHRQICIPN
jgi:hypothetical protein